MRTMDLEGVPRPLVQRVLLRNGIEMTTSRIDKPMVNQSPLSGANVAGTTYRAEGIIQPGTYEIMSFSPKARERLAKLELAWLTERDLRPGQVSFTKIVYGIERIGKGGYWDLAVVDAEYIESPNPNINLSDAEYIELLSGRNDSSNLEDKNNVYRDLIDLENRTESEPKINDQASSISTSSYERYTYPLEYPLDQLQGALTVAKFLIHRTGRSVFFHSTNLSWGSLEYLEVMQETPMQIELRVAVSYWTVPNKYYKIDVRLLADPDSPKQNSIIECYVSIMLDADYIIAKPATKIDEEEKKYVKEFEKFLSQFFADSESLKASSRLYGKLGKPNDVPSFYTALAKEKGIPVKFMKEEEVLAVFGKPHATAPLGGMRGETWYYQREDGSLIEFRMDFGEVREEPRIVEEMLQQK